MPNNVFLGVDPAFGRALRGLRRAPVTPAISALLVASFAGSVALGVDPLSPTSEQVLRVGASFGPALLGGEWWRLLTAGLLHGGLVHLAFNLWAFWGAGQFAERVYGKPAYLAIYLLSATGASLLSVAVAPLAVSVGASGAIFGVYGALFALAWFHRDLFPREFLRRQRSSLLAFLGYNVLFAVVDRRIDAAGHAGGFAVGIALGALLRPAPSGARSGAPRRTLATAAVAVLLAVAAWGVRARIAAIPEARPVVLYREVSAAFSARQYDVAIQKLSEAIATDDSWQPRYLRALALDLVGRQGEALEDAKLATERAPPSKVLDALALRGSLEAELARLDDAARTCALIASHAPWRTPGFHTEGVAFCARVFLTRNDSTAALDWADHLVGADQDSLEGLRVRAEVLERTGRFDRALADLDTVIRKAPSDGWALNARAWLRVGSEDFAGARKDADLAIAADPSSAAAIGTRCFALAGLGDLEGARRDCAHAVELAPPPGAPEDRGMLAFLDGDRAGALRLWLEAAPRSSTNPRALAPWIAKARGESPLNAPPRTPAPEAIPSSAPEPARRRSGIR